MATIESYGYRPATPRFRRFPGQVLHAIVKAADLVYLWQRRIIERQHLQSLDHRMLSDRGLTRADVAAEVRKPFWQA